MEASDGFNSPYTAMSSIIDTNSCLSQAWCQAPENEQAAGIKIVAASMEAAQDVSRTCLPYSSHTSSFMLQEF